MSRVVLRCRKCGTTQSQPGECQACYEAQVSYFCNNHTPGLWLDQPACKECGARFGEPAPTKRPRPSTPPVRPVPPRATRGAEPRRPRPRAAEPEPTRYRKPAEPEATPTEPTLEDLLARISRERREGSGYGDDEAPWREPPPALRLPRPALQGCVFKAVLLALLLLALVLGGPFLLLGGVLPYLFGDSGASTRLMAGTSAQKPVAGTIAGSVPTFHRT